MRIISIAIGAAIMIIIGPLPGLIAWLLFDFAISYIINISKRPLTSNDMISDESANSKKSQSKIEFKNIGRSINSLINNKLFYPITLSILTIAIEIYYFRHIREMDEILGEEFISQLKQNETISFLVINVIIWIAYLQNIYSIYSCFSKKSKLTIGLLFLALNGLYFILSGSFRLNDSWITYTYLYKSYSTQFFVFNSFFILVLGGFIWWNKSK